MKASDASGDDHFGKAVSVSADGNTIVVGADLEDGGGANIGAAYVYFHRRIQKLP